MYQIYKVEPSDTLETIAQRFGTTVDKLRSINGLSNISAGGYILVPSGSMMNNNTTNNVNNVNNVNNDLYDVYIVKQGDNVYAIARQYGVSYETLLRLNGLNKDDYIYPNQQLLIPKSNSGVYVTSESDTIMSLYNANRDNWESFLSQNPMIYIVPDQVITYR